MATSPTKNKPTSRVATSNIGKKKVFTFKPWQALVAVVVASIAGYTIVHFSHASTGVETFRHTASANAISGGTPGLKTNGSVDTSYRTNNINTSAITSNISPSEAAMSKSFCFHYLSGKGIARTSVYFAGQNPTGDTSDDVQLLSTGGSICANKAHAGHPGENPVQFNIFVIANSLSDGSINVDYAYGSSLDKSGGLFTHNPSQMSGGSIKGGVRVLDMPSQYGQIISTPLTPTEVSGVKSVCVRLNGVGKAIFSVDGIVGATTIDLTPTFQDICKDGTPYTTSSQPISVGIGTRNSTVNVSSFYGKP